MSSPRYFSEKMERFCQLYAEKGTNVDLGDMILEAGYEIEDRRHARIYGSRLLGKWHILDRINEIKQQQMAGAGWRPEDVKSLAMETLSSIVMTSPTDIAMCMTFDPEERRRLIDELEEYFGGEHVIEFKDGAAIPHTVLSPRTKTAIKSFYVKYGKDDQPESMKIELHDKIAAVAKMVELAGLTDKNGAFTGSADDFANDPATIAAAMKLMGNMISNQSQTATQTASEGKAEA